MRTLKVPGCLAIVAGLTCGAWGQKLALTTVKSAPALTAPAVQGGAAASHPPDMIAPGQAVAPKPEIHFDAASGIVTVKLMVEDPSGRFIPNIRRENFAVYEDGVRQPNPEIEVEHAPVSLAVVMEWGGRYQSLNQEMYDELPRAAHQLLSEITKQDKIAVWKYGDRPEQIADFSKGHDALDAIFLNLNPPEFSEANLYDALVSTLQTMRSVPGRKALVLLSTGIDTFSKASYSDVLQAARESGTPIYVINVGPALRATVDQFSQSGPSARLDWSRAQRELQEIARVSGGRLYSPNSTFDLSGVYDDMMENLRVRYVVKYKSPAAGSTAARTVRVDLVNPQTGGPLEILDAKGKPVEEKLSMEETYVPHAAPVAQAAGSAAGTGQE